MRIGKGGAHGSQTIDVGGFSLWVPTQVTYPMVQVVNGNEENVGSIVGRDDAGGKDCKKESQEVSFHSECFPRAVPFIHGSLSREVTVRNSIV